MIRMSKAATNASSSSGDDDNDSCNPQGSYNKDQRSILADIILLYIIDMRPYVAKRYKKLPQGSPKLLP